MQNTIKSLVRVFLLFILSSVLVLFISANFSVVQASTDVSGVPKPSVPEFTLKLEAHPYDVPTIYSIDPFTGENVTHAGYHVEQTSIQVKIKNQPFTPYEIQDSKGNDWTINLYYTIRIKGHFSEDWIELYHASDGFPRQESDLDYSLLSYILEPDTDTIWGTKYVTLPAGGQVDFQVEAMIGYVSRANEPPWYPYRLFGETSGWSSTQTITIEDDTPITTPDEPIAPDDTSPDQPTTPEEPTAPNEETFQTEQLAIILGITATVTSVAALATGLLVYFKIRKHVNQKSSSLGSET